MKLTGAEILIEALLEQGTEVVFGYPGGSVINIYDALFMRKDRLRHVLTCHEQGAVHAADGYARTTGRVGVVIATSGPGGDQPCYRNRHSLYGFGAARNCYRECASGNDRQ